MHVTKYSAKNQRFFEISGSRGGEYEDKSLLGLPLFRIVEVKSAMIALMMEAVWPFETLVTFYETTWRNIPEGYRLLVNDFNVLR